MDAAKHEWYGDPNTPLPERLAQVEGLIKKQRDYIANKEMSDDFYYTRGTRTTDIRRLNNLEAIKRGLEQEIASKEGK